MGLDRREKAGSKGKDALSSFRVADRLTPVPQAQSLYHGLGLGHVLVSGSDSKEPEPCSIGQHGTVDS